MMIAVAAIAGLVIGILLGATVVRGIGQWGHELFSNNEARVNTGAVAMLSTVIMAVVSLAIFQFWHQKEMPNQEIIKWCLITGATAYLGVKAEGFVANLKKKGKSALDKLPVPDLGGAGGGTPPEE